MRPETGDPTPPLVRRASAQTAAPVTVTTTLDRWRLLRLVFGLQGLYYLITGLWPLLARALPLPGLFSATALTTDFAGTMIQALTLLIGLVLLLTVARPRPDAPLVALGAGAALAFFLVELRYRDVLRRAVYADLVLELLFLVAMVVIYLAALIYDRRRRA